MRKFKTKLNYKTVQKVLNCPEKQNENAKKQGAKQCNDILIKDKGCIIQGDATYLKTDFTQIPEQEFYFRRVDIKAWE